MPHCLLEYSDNLLEKVDFTLLLSELNNFLSETGLFKIADIKSRAICHDTYVVGEREENRPFVSLDIRILSGRDDQTKAMLSESALKILKKTFSQSVSQMNCSLTVQISDLHRQSYARSGNRP